jgi:Uncharacterised protein family (UPF0259)
VSSNPEGSLSVRGVFHDVAAAYRAHWLFLVVSAIVVLLPQALADSILGNLNVEGIRSARDVAIVAAVPLTIVVNLFGQAFYAGLTAAVLVEWRAHHPLPNIGAVLRTIPIRRLILLDVVLTVGIAVGFVLLVIPGLIFMAFFSISPALVKFEHHGVWGSMRRSRELVRGNFWRVFVTVVGTIVLTEIAASEISAPLHGIGLVTFVDLAVDGVLQPIEGLVIVVVALALLDLRGEAPETAALERAVGGAPAG